MNLKTITRVCASLALVFFPLISLSQSVYCPEKAGYINIGMTQDAVIAACGQPLNKQTNKPIQQQVPVKQLIYTTLNAGSVYPTLNPIFEQWSIPSGSQGTTLEVNVVDGVVKDIRLNNENTDSVTVCNNGSFKVGDPESNVYNACGSASTVNNTMTTQTISRRDSPEVWIYQLNAYDPPITLTFINGKLQSIN